MTRKPRLAIASVLSRKSESKRTPLPGRGNELAICFIRVWSVAKNSRHRSRIFVTNFNDATLAGESPPMMPNDPR